MPNLGAALEAAVSKVTKKEVRNALKELRAGLRRVQRAIERQARKFRSRGATAAAAPRSGKKSGRKPTGGRRAPAGPTMAPREVKALRKRLGLTQAEFARQVGVTHVAVYFWESGRTKPAGDRLARLRELEKSGAASRPKSKQRPARRKAAPKASPGRRRKAAGR